MLNGLAGGTLAVGRCETPSPTASNSSSNAKSSPDGACCNGSGRGRLAATDPKSASCRASRIVFEMHWQCSANNTKVPDKGPLSSGQSTLCCGEGVRQPDCIRLEKAETKHNHQQS